MAARIKFCIGVLGAFLVVALAFYAASTVSNNQQLLNLVVEYGYFGVLFIAFVGGVNIIVPFPPATFTPLFIEAGMSIIPIIFWLSIGTTLADLAGYVFGKLTQSLVLEKYPKTFAWCQELHTNKSHWLIPFVFIYAGLIPFPNEAFIIPLAILGVPLRSFITPMLLGTLMYHSLAAYGFTSVFSIFFG